VLGGKGLLGAVDISPDIGGQNVFRTFETAIRHNRRPTRTELERVFCRWVYFHLRSKIFSVSLTVGGIAPPLPSMDLPLPDPLPSTGNLRRAVGINNLCGRCRQRCGLSLSVGLYTAATCETLNIQFNVTFANSCAHFVEFRIVQMYNYFLHSISRVARQPSG